MRRVDSGSSGARRLLDRAARGLARVLLGVFFRSVEVQGLERVPASGPVLFVANHGNALIDPMVLVALLPRLPRFLAKHTLWSNPAVRPLLELAGAIPVYRAQEGDTAKNQETFARCFEELGRGGDFAAWLRLSQEPQDRFVPRADDQSVHPRQSPHIPQTQKAAAGLVVITRSGGPA